MHTQTNTQRSIRGERDSKKDVKRDALMIGEEGGEGGEKEIQKCCKETAGGRANKQMHTHVFIHDTHARAYTHTRTLPYTHAH